MLLIWHGQPFGGTPPAPSPAPSTTGGWRDYDFLNKPRRDVEADRSKLARSVRKETRKELRRVARKIADVAPIDRMSALEWARLEEARALQDAMLRTALDRTGDVWSPDLAAIVEYELLYLLAFQREDEGAIIALMMEL